MVLKPPLQRPYKFLQAEPEKTGIDYIDIYLIHYPNPSIDTGETMEAMDYLVEKGYIKNIGVSNHSVREFEEAQKHTSNKIVCNQVYYNLAHREPERNGFLEYAQKNDVMIVA